MRLLATSHTTTLPLFPAFAIYFPSGDHATGFEDTVFACVPEKNTIFGGEFVGILNGERRNLVTLFFGRIDLEELEIRPVALCGLVMEATDIGGSGFFEGN